MTIIRKTQPELLPGFFDSFLMKDLFELPAARISGNRSSFPAVNVKETENQFEVELAAPGRKKEDFSVMLENDVLTISYTTKEEKKEEAKNNERFTLKEFSYQSFKRSFNLPEKLVDVEKVEARYQDGILKLVLPKRAEQKAQKKQIEIAG